MDPVADFHLRNGASVLAVTGTVFRARKPAFPCGPTVAVIQLRSYSCL